MTTRFFDLAFTPSVQAEQSAHGSRDLYARAAARRPATTPDVFTVDETGHVSASDTFFIATVSETGWPYVQHRGGPAGFVHVMGGPDQGETQLAWAEYGGNRQYLTVGYAGHDKRVSLIFVDFAHRRRLKVMGHLTAYTPQQRPDLVLRLSSEDARAAERLMTVRVEAYDWNCPQHITPRFTVSEIEGMAGPIRSRVLAMDAGQAGD